MSKKNSLRKMCCNVIFIPHFTLNTFNILSLGWIIDILKAKTRGCDLSGPMLPAHHTVKIMRKMLWRSRSGVPVMCNCTCFSAYLSLWCFTTIQMGKCKRQFCTVFNINCCLLAVNVCFLIFHSFLSNGAFFCKYVLISSIGDSYSIQSF